VYGEFWEQRKSLMATDFVKHYEQKFKTAEVLPGYKPFGHDGHAEPTSEYK
jgi:hypothetical protein